jgi:hypothetical protein
MMEEETTEVVVRVKIIPAFALEIIDDSTGKKWSGHTWYGNTGLHVLRKMRTTLHMGEHKGRELRVKAVEPKIAAATSWKEPVFDTSD